MLLVEMRRLTIDEVADDASEHFRVAVARISEFLTPMIGSLQRQQAEYFNAPDSIFNYGRKKNIVGVTHGPGIHKCEMFATNDFMLIITIQDNEDTRTRLMNRLAFDDLFPRDEDTFVPPQAIYVYAIGGLAFKAALNRVGAIVEDVFGAPLVRVSYSNPRFEDIPSEVKANQIQFDEKHVAIAHVVEDQINRSLALNIVKSRGKSFREIAKHILTDPQQIDKIRDTFVQVGLVTAETGEDPQQELLSITKAGRDVLASSRWMSILVKERLLEYGIAENDILFEYTNAGETDCLVNLSGELIMMEFKDKEFSLGDYYKFAGRLGMHKPRYPIIVTTKYVGGDVKQYLEQTRRNRYNMWDRVTLPIESEPAEKGQNEIILVKGIDQLSTVLEEIISSVYKRDALTILYSALPFALPDPRAILKVIESRLS